MRASRLGRLAGQVLVWAVVLAAAAVAMVLSLPLLAVAVLWRAGRDLLLVLFRHGDALEEVDGSTDGGEPDALTEELARRIDGARPAAIDRLADMLAADEDRLGCGCLDVAWPQHACPRCDWRTCLGHAEAHHYCVGDELPRRGVTIPLPPTVAAAVNDAFSAVIGGHDLDELRGVDQDLARYYLIGDER